MRVLSLLILLSFLGCVSKQTRIALSDQRLASLSSSDVRLEVPFTAQPSELCGPTALKMILDQRGIPVSLKTLSTYTYSPNVKGSTKSDMLGAVRRLGLIPIKIRSLPDLFEEVSRGKSVVVFYNSALSFSTLWHFGVLTGYDLKNKKVYLHAGNTPNQRMNLEFFYERWLEGDLWAMSFTVPGDLPRTVIFDDMMDNLRIFVSLNLIAQARELLEQLVLRFPERQELFRYRQVLL